MKKIIIYFITLLSFFVVVTASAKFIITLTEGDRLLRDDIELGQDSKGEFTIAGIPVKEIKKINFSQINSDVPGTKIESEGLAFQTGVAIWDTESNETSNRNIYSAEYICEIAGLPYFTTESLNEAIEKAKLILITSPLQNHHLTEENHALLKDFIANGGILISPRIDASANSFIKDISGTGNFSGHSITPDRHKVTWDDPSIPECCYFDDEREITYSLGKGLYSTGSVAAINTQAFKLSETDNASSLASYNNGETAVIKNEIGKGAVYTFGIEWKNVIQRSQANKDPDAQRGASNSFDPSADIYAFFLRSAYINLNPLSAWKFTVPDGYSSVLVPTHDCDSKTAYDSMYFLADYEKSLGLKAHYFLTVHYYRDPGYLSAFYNEESIKKIKKLLEAGHTVGSHSIGHFPDFDNSELFPMTKVTKEEYEATCTRGLNLTNDNNSDTESSEPDTHNTKGGSTWAEVVLSKKILSEDFPETDIKSFRSGHLCFNQNIPEALAEGDYSYSSCFTASDVLSQFPFFQRLMPGGNAYSGELTNVLQMPLHFSDVFNNEATPMDENHYKDRVEEWWQILNSLKNNYAASIILIHPNREWKMWAEKELIDKFNPEEIGLYNFQDYGDFWVNRSSFMFDYADDPANNRIIVRTSRDNYEKNPHLGIMVECEEVPEYITLIDENFETLPSKVKKMGDKQYLLMFSSD